MKPDLQTDKYRKLLEVATANRLSDDWLKGQYAIDSMDELRRLAADEAEVEAKATGLTELRAKAAEAARKAESEADRAARAEQGVVIVRKREWELENIRLRWEGSTPEKAQAELETATAELVGTIIDCARPHASAFDYARQSASWEKFFRAEATVRVIGPAVAAEVNRQVEAAKTALADAKAALKAI